MALLTDPKEMEIYELSNKKFRMYMENSMEGPHKIKNRTTI